MDRLISFHKQGVISGHIHQSQGRLFITQLFEELGVIGAAKARFLYHQIQRSRDRDIHTGFHLGSMDQVQQPERTP